MYDEVIGASSAVPNCGSIDRKSGRTNKKNKRIYKDLQDSIVTVDGVGTGRSKCRNNDRGKATSTRTSVAIEGSAGRICRSVRTKRANYRIVGSYQVRGTRRQPEQRWRRKSHRVGSPSQSREDPGVASAYINLSLKECHISGTGRLSRH